MIGYVVESPVEVKTKDGEIRTGTARHWVATEARAVEEAAKHPDRTWRAVPFDEIPFTARENLLRALAPSA